MNINNIDISFIQEPWVRERLIQGLDHQKFNLFYNVPEENCRLRACILIKKTTKAFLLTEYHDDDTTSVVLECDNKYITLVSANMAHDKDIPTSLVYEVTTRNYDSIVGCDANARHVVWGNLSTNERCEYFADVIN